LFGETIAIAERTSNTGYAREFGAASPSQVTAGSLTGVIAATRFISASPLPYISFVQARPSFLFLSFIFLLSRADLMASTCGSNNRETATSGGDSTTCPSFGGDDDGIRLWERRRPLPLPPLPPPLVTTTMMGRRQNHHHPYFHHHRFHFSW
jgi:hypothetical protein